jgi:hypothetical protein
VELDDEQIPGIWRDAASAATDSPWRCLSGIATGLAAAGHDSGIFHQVASDHSATYRYLSVTADRVRQYQSRAPALA